MMNPQYFPPGQNNNAPNNPLGFPPTSQEYNGVQNANIYSQMPPNGSQIPLNGPQPPQNGAQMPPKSDSDNMTQKMQNMNIHNPQGFSSIPNSQLPPGQLPGGNMPTANYGPGPGQRPPQYPPGRPPVSGAPQFPPSTMGQNPPMSAPGPMQTQTQAQNIEQQRQFAQPPVSMEMQGPKPPSSQSSQPQGSLNQLPPSSQPGLPPQGMMSRPGMPQQPGPKPGMNQQQGIPQQHPQGHQNQQSLPPHSAFSQPQPPAIPPMPNQQGQGQLPGRPGIQQGPMPTHQGQMPPQQGQMPPQQGQMPPQQGQMPHQQGQMPPQQGQMPHQQGHMPPQPGMPPQQGHMPPQPGMQSQQGHMPLQQGHMPPQQGHMQPQQGHMPPQQRQMPPQSGMHPQPSIPPLPVMPSQPSIPPLPVMPSQPSVPPLPVMPQHPGMQTQPGMQPQHGQLQPQPGMPLQPGMAPQQGQFQQRSLRPGPMPSQNTHVAQKPPLQAQPGMQLQPGPMPPQHQIQQQPGMAPQSGPYPSVPGLPHMPPPLSQQQRPQYPNMQPINQQPTFQHQQPQAPYTGMPPGSGYPPAYAHDPPQTKQLNPDQMPSPIQVMAEDQAARGGVFATNEKGLLPPLVTTDFLVDDKGNASPRFIRSSMYSVPVTADLLKQTALPFCLSISPMAETVGAEAGPPLLDVAALTGAALGPVRCARCKAYMCPNMKFLDAGRHFKCAFCKATTEVPMEYTQYINTMQQYGRVPAEMALGTYEFVATKEYCRNNTLPNAPAIVFVIDVSYNSVKSGLLSTVCDNVLNIIEAMPKDEQTGKSWTRVGFITYSSTVHFYNIKGTLAQPQMLSVGDVGDMFVPLLEGFLVLPEEAGPVLHQLLQQLPAMFQANKETETILLPAVQAGLEALKAADTSGQLLVFHTSLPTFNAPGKLVNREDRKLLGTEKEKQILNPQTTAYNELGQSCCAAGVSVELFVCNNSYVDLATLGQLCRLTGGQLHKYTYYSDSDAPRLVWDACRVAARPTAHDAVMRVRTSTGVRPTDFYGHMFMSNTTDVELAAIDSDKGIGVEIKHDDKLTGEDGVYIQAALLYTHRSGQRRLRIINLALNVAAQLADVYRSTDTDTTVGVLCQAAVWALRDTPPRAVRDALAARAARSLATYRRHCASPSSTGQLVLPESMKLLPLYVNCLLRSDALAGGPDMTCDERSLAMYRALSADVRSSVVYTYPRLLPLHRILEAPPAPLRASADKMQDHGVYLLENGVHMLMWVGSQAAGEFCQGVFGVPSAAHVDTQVTELPALDNPLSEAVRDLVRDLRDQRRSALRLTVMRQHDKLETVLRQFLVEDRGVDGSPSYVDFLCHVHKEIRALL